MTGNRDLSKALTLLGGGASDPADLAESLARAPGLVALDGGADVALAAGHTPALTIGDMDSISGTALAALPPDSVIRVDEQDTTDFEKGLSRVSAPLILGVGFTGGRHDHMLAALSVLVRLRPPCVLLGGEDVIFAAPRRVMLDLAPGTRVSLFPLAPVTGRSRGLEWPIDGLTLSPVGRVGTSNRALGPVELSFDGPGPIVLLPRSCLDQAIAAVTA
ncbi:thiamine pyrophosphokinase [Palleronia salina]|uniref:Thiamine diphosphokinase n=1 Tax=Palleronia salina TaxID=313368 RepID=A0A1M6H1W2_9RHOB|nr:thiamine diphosphokinase [Palleronia salina]SHJ16179.1 thiamine pyrophosphokinase [Palleronia salina]